MTDDPAVQVIADALDRAHVLWSRKRVFNEIAAALRANPEAARSLLPPAELVSPGEVAVPIEALRLSLPNPAEIGSDVPAARAQDTLKAYATLRARLGSATSEQPS
jgi:hypothetical protein